MPLRSVTVSGFEGPLDLLLDLIEREKLDISRVSLAAVTNQYFELLRKMDNLSPEELAQFLVVAARLILIKSKRLLPRLALTPEEEESIESLEQQLFEYQKFREKARLLQKLWQADDILYGREGYLGITVAFYPPPESTPELLHNAVHDVVKGLPKIELTREEAIARVVSLEERVNELKDRIRKAATTSFRDTVVKGSKKIDVIIFFLALLELVKQRIVEADQQKTFHDILIRKRADK